MHLEDFGEIDPTDAATAAGDASDAALGKQLDDELSELPFALRAAGGVAKESVRRDMSGLSEAALVRAVEADAPELLHLLGDFRETLKEARTRVAPLLAAARQRQLPPEGGVNLLQVKLQLMLSYATNLSFYLLLKAQGRTVKEHPVIESLLRHRILLERLRPLEQKMSYRLQKLLQLANASEAIGGADGAAGTLGDLSERPNPDALLHKGGGARGKGDDDDDDDDAGAGGLYRPPKMAAVAYDDDEPGGSKKERQRQRAVERASQSRLVRELREELSDGPRRIHADDFGGSNDADSVAVARLRQEESERRAYEEDNMKRLHLTKDQKRAQRVRERAAQGGGMDEYAQFDDFSHLYSVAQESNEPVANAREEKMRALRQYMNSIEQRGGKNMEPKRKRSAEDDAPTRKREERMEKHAAKKNAREQDDDLAGLAIAGDDAGEDFDDDEDDGGGRGRRKGNGKKGGKKAVPEEDAFYAEMAAATHNKKQQKAQRRTDAAEADAEAIRSGPTDTAEPGTQRKINRAIEKNRGLTRERKKIDANPRVKNREKFRKATIRRNGQVRAMQDNKGDGSYAGEATGIKKNVSHSRRF